MGGKSTEQPIWKYTLPESWARLQRVNETAAQLQNYWPAFLSFGAFVVATVSGARNPDGVPVYVSSFTPQG